MNLQDKHKEYAVKCYASFMQTSSIIDGFIQQFWDDLAKPKNTKSITTVNETIIYRNGIRMNSNLRKSDIYFANKTP